MAHDFKSQLAKFCRLAPRFKKPKFIRLFGHLLEPPVCSNSQNLFSRLAFWCAVARALTGFNGLLSRLLEGFALASANRPIDHHLPDSQHCTYDANIRFQITSPDIYSVITCRQCMSRSLWNRTIPVRPYLPPVNTKICRNVSPGQYFRPAGCCRREADSPLCHVRSGRKTMSYVSMPRLARSTNLPRFVTRMNGANNVFRPFHPIFTE